MTAIDLSASKLMRSIELKIRLKGVRTLNWRIWLGKQVFKLGAVIIGCGLIFEHDENGR